MKDGRDQCNAQNSNASQLRVEIYRISFTHIQEMCDAFKWKAK